MRQHGWAARRRGLGPLIAAALLAAAPGAYALNADQVFDQVSASVVLVRALQNNVETIGSGVVAGRERIVTTCHIVSGRTELSVKWGETRLPATLEHMDAQRDLCLLFVPGLQAPAAGFASLDTARIGQRVYAVGNPEGLELTLSDGLISAIRTIRGFRFIQTSAPVASGSSGGGLFDTEGRLIGITTAGGKEGVGLNFAIPADQVSANPAFAAAIAEPAPPTQATAEGNEFPRVLGADEILAHFSRFKEVDANREHRNPFKLTVSFGRSPVGSIERRCAGCRQKFGNGRVRLVPSQNQLCFDWFRVTYPESGCFQLMQMSENKFALRPVKGRNEITYAVRP